MAFTWHDPVLEVDQEASGDTFATLNGDFASEAKLLRIANCSATLGKESLSNDLYTDGLGINKPIVGLSHPFSSVSFDSEAQGLVTAAGDATAATATAVTYLACAVCGQAPDLSTGALVEASPTPTVSQFTEDSNGAHGVGQLVAIGLSTGIEVRPITAYSTGAITLGIKASAAPATGNVLYGGANAKWADNPSFLQKCQMKLVGNDLHQNYTVLGAVGSLSLSEAAPNESQMLSWEYKVAEFSDLASDTKQDPGESVRAVLAGGQFIIALEGTEQDWMCGTYGSISASLNADYTAVPDPCDAKGLQGWLRNKGSDFEVTIHVPHDFDPSATATAGGTGGLGTTEDTWREIWRTGTDNAFQVLLQYGTTAGRIFAVWFRSLYLAQEPEMVELDGIAAQKLTFKRKTGTAYGSASNWNETNVPPCVVAQF